MLAGLACGHFRASERATRPFEVSISGLHLGLGGGYNVSTTGFAAACSLTLLKCHHFARVERLTSRREVV